MDNMSFPATPDEFIKQYSFKDEKEVYTNGAELISVIRVKQLIDHYYLEPEQEFLNKTEAKVQEMVEERDALRTHNKAVQKQNDTLRDQLDQLTRLHEKAVERVNKVNFAKLKVENQLELLQSTIGAVLARFQVDTEE